MTCPSCFDSIAFAALQSDQSQLTDDVLAREMQSSSTRSHQSRPVADLCRTLYDICAKDPAVEKDLASRFVISVLRS